MTDSEYEKKDSVRGIDHIGVNCIFFCHDGKGNVLFGKRSQKCRDEQGRWDAGAGAVEFGETFEDAVRREVREEYGADPLEIEYVNTRSVIREHNGRTTHWVANLHLVRVDPAEVRNGDPEKIDEIGWFPVDAPPAPPHSQQAHEIEAIRAYIKRR